MDQNVKGRKKGRKGSKDLGKREKTLTRTLGGKNERNKRNKGKQGLGEGGGNFAQRVRGQKRGERKEVREAGSRVKGRELSPEQWGQKGVKDEK